MSFLSDFLTYKFLTYALIGGVTSAFVCSLLSPFVVLKRMAFIGQGISHAAFGGVALALLLKTDGLLMNVIIILFCLGVSTLIWHFSEKRKVSEDTGIGIFLSVSMAISIVLLSFRTDYTSGLLDYLFGSILAITLNDIYINIILLAIVLGTILLFFKELSFVAFDSQIAYASGINAPAFHFILLSLISFTIVISMKIIGIVLLSAFMVLPGASARFVAGSLKSMIKISVVISLFTTLSGLVISNVLDIPSGASIVLLQFAVFLVMLSVKKKNKG
jgi:zinc transport system permease protein